MFRYKKPITLKILAYFKLIFCTQIDPKKFEPILNTKGLCSLMGPVLVLTKFFGSSALLRMNATLLP
jgi:hypothetical protein